MFHPHYRMTSRYGLSTITGDELKKIHSQFEDIYHFNSWLQAEAEVAGCDQSPIVRTSSTIVIILNSILAS